MRDVVLITCWRRAEFLAVTLRDVVAAEKARRQHYVFLVDEGYAAEVLDVVRAFPLEHEIVINTERPMRGNSYNILSGFAYARRTGCRLTYLIEEDVRIARDFFVFHEAVHARFRCFFASAVRNQNDDRTLPPRRSLIYFNRSYQSLGVSFPRRSLDAIVEHHRPEFYAGPTAYVARHFPDSRIAAAYAEQDGLIHRIVEQRRERGAYPFVPRAYHAGFVGYNRPGRALRGTLDERIARLQRMTDAEANGRATQFRDIRSCDLEKRHAPLIRLARPAP